MSLNLLLDSANIKQWDHFYKLGIFKGITTNPSLLKDSSLKCDITNLKRLSQYAEELGCESLHLQAWGQSTKELITCGKKIGAIRGQNTQIYVKVPITENGTKAAIELIKEGIKITFTACFSAPQILIAESIGAKYIAPYLGRIEDSKGQGLSEIVSMQKALKETNSCCKLLVASIREIDDIIYLASKGIDTFTLNTEIAKKLFEIKETNLASSKFEKDANLIIDK